MIGGNNMAVFGNRVVDKLTFFQWINVEYGIVKRQYKELIDREKQKLKKEYQDYLKETEW